MLRITFFFPQPLFLLSPTAAETIFLFVLFSDTSVLVAGFFFSPVQQFQTSYVTFCFLGELCSGNGAYTGSFLCFFCSILSTRLPQQ